MRAWATLTTALALGGAPAAAAGAPQDVSATHAYIQASHRLLQLSVSSIPPSLAKIGRLNSRLARECPLAAAGSPQNDASQPVSGLVVVAEWSIAYGNDAGPINAFLHATNRLRWANNTITRTAHHYAQSLHEMATLPEPNLCQVIAAWKASSFQVVPAGVDDLVRHAEVIQLVPVPARLLAPFERAGDARLLADTGRLEGKVAEAESVDGVRDTFQLLETLALNE
jgi:hypothetical protein